LLELLHAPLYGPLSVCQVRLRVLVLFKPVIKLILIEELLRDDQGP